MATNSRFVRALQLQRIANTSRKFTPTASTTIPDTPTVLKSLPEHKPLLPLLLSHNIPPKVAQTCADRFDRYANQLRSETETQLVPYLVNRRKNQPAKVYSFFLDSYSQALRDWAQSILNAALKGLKRAPADIRNWDVTLPSPLWLPSPQDLRSTTTQIRIQTPSSLSSIPAPPHAFPTTYPPPLRPPCTILPVEWTRTLAASPRPSSSSTVDLDSLCTQFAKSLVIDENRVQPTQIKPSIFSLPATLKDGPGVASVRTKRNNSRKPTTAISKTSISRTTLTLPHKNVKPRRPPTPPSVSQTSPKVRTTSRKISVPAPTTPFQRNAISSNSFPNIPTSTLPPPRPLLNHSGSVGSYFGLKTLQVDSLRSPLDLRIGPTTSKTSISLCLSSGPTTPPINSSDLFSEPAVASPAPFELSESFLSTQFPLHSDLYTHDFMISPYHDAGSSFDLPPGGSLLKSGCDAYSIPGYPISSFDPDPLTSGSLYS